MSLPLLVIAPHGAHALPGLVPEGAHSRVVADALARVRTAAKAYGIETWVVITPHGIRVQGGITLSVAETARGHLPGARGLLSAQFGVDLELVGEIFRQANNLPVLPVSFGVSEIPLDWGVLIPLAAVGEEDVQLVVVCPSELPGFGELLAFGTCLGVAAQRHSRRVAILASADLCHTHRHDGPYGYHPEAERLDREIVASVEQGDLTPLYRLPTERIAAGKPDGLWSMACLDGARQVAPYALELLVYDRPSYYGMMVALFHRIER